MVYNVIFNSDWAFLIVMVFVHNSMKLKSTLMKKVSPESYALAIFADIRCRFQKFLFVFFIMISNPRGVTKEFLLKLVIFLSVDFLIEWIK